MPGLSYFAGRMRQALVENRGAEYKTLARQLYELVDLICRGHVEPSEYYAYGFSRRDVGPEEMARFLPARIHWRRVLPRVNQRSWPPIVQNKWLFHQHYRSFGLPLPGLIGVFHPRHGLTKEGAPLRSLEQLQRVAEDMGVSGIVLKPISGSAGHDVMVFSTFGFSRLESITGVEVSPAQLQQQLNSVPDEGYLVEERVLNHSVLNEINPYTATSIRLGTLRDRSGGMCVPYALVRFGRSGSTVDNTAQGGLYASIDTESGVMSEGNLIVAGAWKHTTSHPDSGTTFAGRAVPDWGSIIQLVRDAAEHSGGLNSIGWDVLLTQTGPVLLEGNHDWDPLGQVASNGYLSQPVVEALRTWGIELRNDDLPAHDLRETLRSIRWIVRKTLG